MEKTIEAEAITNPKILFLEDGQSVQLVETVGAMVKPDKTVYLVPKDFVCDGASIPRWLWWIAASPLTGKYRDVAIIHDAAYSGRLEEFQDAENPKDIKLEKLKLTRHELDRLFLAAMLCRGCNPARAWIKYAAVRIFGKSHYKTK